MRYLLALAVLLTLLGLPAVAAGSPGEPTPHLGELIGTISIAKLHLQAPIRQGTDTAQLNLGPSHYAWTHLPGQGETVAVAAHRTTYGAWFRHIDQLSPGDAIVITVRPKFGGGTFRYTVTGHRIVPWNAGRTLVQDKGHERLILTACHPAGSDAQRYVIYALPAKRAAH